MGNLPMSCSERKHTLKRLGWFILAGCLLIAIAIARRPTPDLGPPAERVVRFYDVSDLLNLPAPQAVETADDSPPPIVPASRLGVRPPFVGMGSGGNSGGGGGLFGSGGAAGGRGTPPDPEKQRFDELVQLVSASTLVDRFATTKAGTVNRFGRNLVVVETRENQQVVRELLHQLRTDHPPQVRLDIIWATLRTDDLKHLIIAGGSPATLIDEAALNRLAGAILWRGHILCTTGQRARLICGRAYTVPTEIDAVVGNDDAAIESRSQELLDGATVEIIPSLSPNAASVTLDLRSEVTRSGPPGQSPAIEIPLPVSQKGTPAGGGAKIDRLNLGVQTLATAMRGPTGKAILIGGTIDPDAPATDPRQLYLIIRATEASKAASDP
jgi:hypothetical protein